MEWKNFSLLDSYKKLEAIKTPVSLKKVMDQESGAERVRKYYPIEVVVTDYDSVTDIADPEIFVQTTSVGMGNDVDGTPVKKTEFFDNVKIVVDIIYTPWETRLMKDAAARGALTVNGFDMLFYQGLASFEIWHDMKVDRETAKELKEKLQDS